MDWNQNLTEKANEAKGNFDALETLEYEAIDRRCFAALDVIRALIDEAE